MSDTYPAAATVPRDVERIVDGVFFTRPARLPRGPHRMDRAEIEEAQRERFLIAFTELLAARGYGSVRINDIAARSGSSKTAFYACFGSLDDCATAAYNRFVTVLLRRMSGQLENTQVDRGVSRILHAYLATLQSDIVVARAFQLEFHNDDPSGRTRRREALLQFANLIRAEHLYLASHDSSLSADLPIQAYVGIIYAVRQLASDSLDTSAQPDLIGLVETLRSWITASLTKRS